MGTPQEIANLNQVVAGFEQIEREKLLRPSLGEASLSEFTATLAEIKRKLDFAVTHAAGVHDPVVVQVRSIFDGIKRELETQSKRSNAEYVNHREAFLQNVQTMLQQLQQGWPAFIAAAVESRGFLQDQGIRKEYENTITSMKDEASKALDRVKEEATKSIEEARELAKQIEERARRTAAHISVEEAQKQFRLAQDDHRSAVRIWVGVSVLSVAAFLAVAYYYSNLQLPEKWSWHVLYYTAIRITILTTFAAVAAFSLRVLRGHMHMFQHNLHRQRVANSMAAFVESAITPEQRDLILAHLVDAIASFGSSGLLGKDEPSPGPPKMTIDSIMRNFGPRDKNP